MTGSWIDVMREYACCKAFSSDNSISFTKLLIDRCDFGHIHFIFSFTPGSAFGTILGRNRITSHKHCTSRVADATGQVHGALRRGDVLPYCTSHKGSSRLVKKGGRALGPKGK